MRNELKRDKLTKEIYGEPGDDADRVVSVIRDAYTTFNSRQNNLSVEKDDREEEGVPAEDIVPANESAAEFESTLMEMGFSKDPDQDEEADEHDRGGDLHPYLLADVYKEGWANIKLMDIKTVR